MNWATRLMEWISTRTGGVTGSGYEPGDEPQRLSDDADELAEQAGGLDPQAQAPPAESKLRHPSSDAETPHERGADHRHDPSHGQ